jgi:hypothetical protein
MNVDLKRIKEVFGMHYLLGRYRDSSCVGMTKGLEMGMRKGLEMGMAKGLEIGMI